MNGEKIEDPIEREIEDLKCEQSKILRRILDLELKQQDQSSDYSYIKIKKKTFDDIFEVFRYIKSSRLGSMGGLNNTYIPSNGFGRYEFDELYEKLRNINENNRFV